MNRWLILAEGPSAGQFEPLDATRPCFALRDGAFTNAERWIALLKPTAVTYETRESLAPAMRELQSTLQAVPSSKSKPDEIWTVEGMVQPLADKLWLTGKCADFTWTSGKCRVSKVSSKPGPKAPTPQALPFRAIDGLWNLIEHLGEQLEFDAALWSRFHKTPVRRIHSPSKGVHVVGKPKSLWVGKNVKVYPHNVLNTESGPIILDDDVTLEPFNRIDGPAYIGRGTSLLGGKFTNGTAIGPGCKIGGEWEASIAQGFVNKAHAGFFGHGFLGEWVNLGAMTTNSDLKNNYGTVRVNRAGAETETRLIKVGSFIADHCKTGIGTLIPTGATWGIGVNYFGGDLAPKFLPPFVWGAQGKLVEHKLDKMIATANAAMKRRSAILKLLGRRDHVSDAEAALLGLIFNESSRARSSVQR
jgi:UDP-N-acetylglucosamine diphosphorylase/glucosamine-1-phosphate N-acetyltransferase